MIISRWICVCAALCLLLSACANENNKAAGSDSDGDADGDTDGDTDSDSDADSDGDSDGDSDITCEEECPVNSGYPCPCDQTTCDDGTQCQEVTKFSYGMCAKPCSGNNECASDIECDAEGECSLVTGAGNYCAYTCNSNADCPSNMECADFAGTLMCVPGIPDPTQECSACEMNSGYPCPCTANNATCDDGSLCVIAETGDPVGACLRPCDWHNDCFSDFDCGGLGSCGLAVGSQDYCAYSCADSSNCPDSTFCNGWLVPEVPFCSGMDNDACPMDSGYPCACSQVNGECDDGSPCLSVDGISQFCAPDCGGIISNPVCLSTKYGISSGEIQGGACAVNYEENIQGNCAIVCALQAPDDGINLTSLCPPGLTCATSTIEGVTQGYCQ